MLFHDLSDEELFLLLKEGDERALNAIVKRYWQPLFQMAAYTLKDLQECEDIIQNIFVRIWERKEKIDFNYSLKAYLFASTRYGIYNHVKKMHSQENSLSQKDFQFIEYYNPENELECKELLENVEKIVNSLPNQCRTIYQLSRNEKLSHQEISSLLNITPKTVENQITIALRRIRTGLGKVLFLL